jgi:uncharacterized membrane protein YeiH
MSITCCWRGKMSAEGSLVIGQFALPLSFDLAATFFFAVTGGLTAMRKEYDFVGVFFLALVTGLGGGLLRDGLFLQQTPTVMESHYLLTVFAATVISLVFGERLNHFAFAFMLLDAIGLGLYAMVGVQKALSVGIAWVPAILIGVINAVGGGLIRDLMTREEPLIFRPGEFYAAAAFLGSALFVLMVIGLGISAEPAALTGIATIILIRVASVRFGWKTKAARPLVGRGDGG